MKKIADIKYEDVHFKFIGNHWDVHLNGTCIYNGELCEFKNEYPEFNEELDEWEEMMVEIYQLNFLEKLKWYKRQRLFEQCVGYHWTYGSDKGNRGFYYRKPKWLYKFIFNLYYKIQTKK